MSIITKMFGTHSERELKLIYRMKSFEGRQKSSRSAWQRARRWMIFWLMLLLPCGRRPDVPLEWNITGFS